MNTEEYTKTFSSYSGADIAATFNGRVIGELQALNYSISREVAPIYTMSSADPRSFSRGKRGISGSLVFVTFDRDALLEEMRKDYGGNAPALMKYQTFRANAGSIQDQILSGLKSRSADGADTYGITTWDEQMTNLGYGSAGDFNPDNLTGFYEPEYADQLMPFNITITMANEFGNRSGMEIHGIQLLNEGSGFSIDDVVTAKAYSFVARKIKGIKRKDNLRYEGRSSARTSGGDLLA
ncbi:hypothetical protein [Virgibacillus salexigens]|uniref:Uncharacterized protein n=1 Tax=Virgibacillus massiliensis TaxID=1462526 RepID=A0A024QGX5_9BACI|nr:hypothetical protein [Virgibacillus massiliensis]CDQ41813.1 hypothetical protein BN990_04190 [Virgibacillus massiliensis]